MSRIGNSSESTRPLRNEGALEPESPKASPESSPSKAKPESPTASKTSEDYARTRRQEQDLTSELRRQEVEQSGGQEVFRRRRVEPESPKKPSVHPKLKDLPSETQQEVQKRLNANAKNPAAQANYMNLATDANFKKLSPVHQKQMLEALDAAPSNVKLKNDLTGLASSERFRNLNSDTASELLKRMKTGDEKVREHIMSMANSDGFALLNKDHQKEMLLILDKNPGDVRLMMDLHELAGSSNFRTLPDSTKSKVLSQLAKHPNNIGARDTIATLAKAQGFLRMNEEDRSVLLRYIGGTNTEYSVPARKQLAKLLKSPEFINGDPATQEGKLKKFLTDQPSMPHATTAPEGYFDGKRAAYTISGPTVLPSGALKYDVEIEGKKIPITVDPAKPGIHSHTIEETAKALAATPAMNRNLIKEVHVKSETKPGSYMSANGSAGVVTIFANSPEKASQTFMDSAMIHETGHILSGTKFGNDLNDKRWNAWKDAMKQDQINPSKYGKSSIAEDFSETLLLYRRVKGTPQEAEIRAMMPERFRLMDEFDSGRR